MLRRISIAPSPAEPIAIDALDRADLPRFGPSIADLARPGMRVTIAFTDATRRTPDDRLIARMLRELEQAGVRRSDVSLLCATGLHRPMTADERDAKLGHDLAGSVRVLDHHPLSPPELRPLRAIRGLPVVVNRHCVEADLLLATGVVEPHQYAGYSGGAKTVVIGCGGEATIAATHGQEMIDSSGVRLGAIDNNPFQRFLREAGAAAGLRYVFNVVIDADGALIAAACGEPTQVHDHLVATARRAFEVTVTEPAHIAIAGVPASKAANLYQASRAATYLALADGTPLLDGAPIILPAAIPDGAGDGTGEQRFYELLSQAESPAELVERLRRTGFPAGAQRAYILAKTLVRHPVILAGAQRPELAQACHMHAVPTLDAALELGTELARSRFGTDDLTVLDVPNALVTLARTEH